jgi:hypothetical protein
MKYINKVITFIIVIIIILSTLAVILFFKDQQDYKKTEKEEQQILPKGVNTIIKTYNFSEPLIEEKDDFIVVRITQTDFQSMGDGRPVLPFNLTTLEFPFGTEIISLDYTYSTPKVINISKKISYASCSSITTYDTTIYQNNEMYPSDFLTYHTGGGISENKHKTFLNIRINPVTYIPFENKLYFIDTVDIKIFYKEPSTNLLDDKDKFDLLIITPQDFSKNLEPLVDHKERKNIKTLLTTVEEIYKKTQGRDEAEKIKYYIKSSIENFGIKSVLLIGGRDGQSSKWTLPVRYSHVIIREGTQEKIEPSFLSDLYFADIYDSKGNFSSWDSDNDNVFAEYDGKVVDKMDLYPDVQIGRLPCRNKMQVKTIVDKIIKYETNTKGNWFDNIILVSGDHWPDKNNIAEGLLIMDKTKEIMSDFTPIEIYATEEDKILVRDINKALNKGAGFAYFSGHGGVSSWGIHYPPDASGWAPSLGKLGMINFYYNIYMKLLRNKNKYPVTVVGGCYNGKFDVTLLNNKAICCWAWQLTRQKNGGSIATIANTGLGTHAKDDTDYNNINDYLEVYDGWLELKFFKLYSDNNIKILGTLHQEAITNYLHVFLGNNDEMDTKMVQQWQLFGDPSLKIH